MARRFAAADIGSNTAHLLVADVEDGKVRRIANVSEWLSLGQVVAKKGSVPAEVERNLVGTLKQFSNLAKRYKAESLYVFATEAIRKAKGYCKLIERIEDETGLTIDVIKPEREAELALRGAMIDMPTTRPSHFLEVGGGSAQAAYWEGGRIVAEKSLSIGTGVLLARHGVEHPTDKAALQALRTDVQAHLGKLDDFPDCKRLVASGGVARGIWRALHPDGEPNIDFRELEYLEWATSRLNLGQIERRFHVKEKRAATLLVGSVVYKLLMEHLQHTSMRVSMFGVREGAVLDMCDGVIRGAEL